MKYLTKTVQIAILLMLSCNTPNQEIQQKDSTAKETSDTVVTLKDKDNLVRSEAPDTKTKTDQGYGLPKHDNGMSQSPINIASQETKKDRAKDFSIVFNTEIVAAENLGHTIQLDFKEGSTCVAGGKTYETRQFHFHTPSEHLIDGMTFPMEMHIVSILKDSNEKSNPSYLVIGVLFKTGRENKFIKEFFNAVPNEEGKKDSIPVGAVRFEDLSAQILKNTKASFYEYNGSLTTPPFTERVDWVVLKQILEASADQIAAIEKMEGNNARHVQALYDRKVLSH